MPNHSYFVVMQDFGRRGREAVVDPENTYRDVVDLVASGEYRNIIFIHHVVSGEPPEDLTEEILSAAEVRNSIDSLMAEAAQ